MPKKIKKRTKKTEEERDLALSESGASGPELLDEDGMPIRQGEYEEVENFGDIVVAIPEHERDTFEKISHETANWLERNRPVAIALVALVLAAPLIAYGVWYQVQQSAISESNDITEAIEAYQYPVKDSPMMKFFEQNDKFAKPDTIYPTTQAKWEAVYERSGTALTAHPSDDLSVAARYSKAGAAYQLGKYDEAIALYNEVLGDERGDALHLFATLGLAMSQAGKGDIDASILTFDKLKTMNESYVGFAQYHKGRVLEASGKSDAAKEAYNTLLESDSNTTYKADVERRLSTM